MSVVFEQLSCQEFVELVTDYLEGALSPEDTARFETTSAAAPVARPISSRSARRSSSPGG